MSPFQTASQAMHALSAESLCVSILGVLIDQSVSGGGFVRCN